MIPDLNALVTSLVGDEPIGVKSVKVEPNEVVTRDAHGVICYSRQDGFTITLEVSYLRGDR